VVAGAAVVATVVVAAAVDGVAAVVQEVGTSTSFQ
jgi:hypothetical protein